METQNKGKTVKMGSFLIVVFLLIYVPSLLHWIYGGDVATEIIRIGVIEDSINTDGYIIRDEMVLKSPFQGNCLIEAGEGEKVAAGYRIATVLKNSADKLYEELRAKDVEILKAQEKKIENQGLFSEDIMKIDEDIAEKLRLIIDENNINSLSGTRQIRSDIVELVKKKASIFGSRSKSDTYVNSLKQEKAVIEEKIRSNTTAIITQNPGIISYAVDGYESKLTPAVIKSITPTYLENIKVKGAKKVFNNFEVELNKPFAKVIKDIEAYIVMTIGAQNTSVYKVGNTVEIRVLEINKVIKGTVDFISKPENGKCAIAVKIDEAVSDTACFRKVNVDLINRRYEGLKVPLSSLRNIDLNNMKADIVLDKGNYADVRQVSIKGKNSESAIIDNPEDMKDNEGVSLYDSYILNPGNIQEGQMIRK